METEQGLKPKFLPLLTDVKRPTTSEEAVDTIAFVLAGVDPAERYNLSHGHMDLRSLAADHAVKRVGPSSALRDDHKYILAPLFDFKTVDFEEIWQDAKEVPSGQEATEFLKLAKQLHRFEIDAEGSELRAPSNAELIKQVREHSHRLLHRLYRSAVRHVEESVKKPCKTPSPPWYVLALDRLGFRKRAMPASVHVDNEIRDEATRYIRDSIKIGRILRVGRRG